MVPSFEHIPAPPGYSSQCDEPSPIQSFRTPSNASHEDLVSSQSYPVPSPSRPLVMAGGSTVQYHEDVPATPATPRRKSTSLPYDNSSTFPPQLQYHYVRGTSISITGPVETAHTAAAPALEHALASQTPMRLNPTNYVSVSRKSTSRRRALFYRSSAPITGKYTVNPYMHVPAALLSQASLATRADTNRYRKNLRFEVENGRIDVDIYLVGEPTSAEDANTTLRTTLDLKIKGGEGTTFPLIAKIHTPELPRPPFFLSASGVDGYHSIHIPASFHGLVTITVAAGDLDLHMSLSRLFLANSIIMNETSNARSYFVGELGGWTRDKEGWDGDKIDVGVARGMVRLQFLGEKGRDGLGKFRWRFGF
ncbi:hypothetical protein DXG01_001284 [Tephrocybe rancida]|nr:hypothetical protein DXG01_001284 [Tephrocybe rancida]